MTIINIHGKIIEVEKIIYFDSKIFDSNYQLI